MSQFFDHDVEIVAVDAMNPDTHRRWTMSELLPDGFRFRT